MKKLILSLALLLIPAVSFSMVTSAERVRLDKHTPVEGLGTHLSRTKNTVRCSYDFAVQGGAVGSVTLLDEKGNSCVIPDNAIITQAYIDILTAIVSTGNNGTIALTANSAGDLLAAVDGDTLSGVTAGVPVGTAATMVKLTAQRTIVGAIATNAFTAGKFDVFLDYVLGQ